MFRRWRRPRSITALVMVLSLVASVPGAARADSAADQKKKVEQLAAELTNLNERIAVLDEHYGAALDKKTEIDAKIAASQAQLAEQQAQLDQLQGTLTDIAVSRFVGNNTHDLSALFASAQVYSQAEQINALSSIAYDTGAGNADELQSLIRKVDNLNAVLQSQQRDATDLINSLDQSRTEGERLIAEYTKKEADAKAKYGQLVQEEADRLAEARAAAAAAGAQQNVGIVGDNGGGNNGNDNGGTTPAPPRGGGNGGNNGGNNGGGNNGGGNGGGSTPAPKPKPQLPVPPPSGRAGTAVSAAYSQLGVPYVAFEASPSRGFDCSGLTSWAWAQAGVYMPHQSGQQYRSFPHVSRDQAEPGDLVFFYNPIHHVGMYVGGGMMIDAPHTGAVVRLVAVKWGSVVGLARPG
jgi:cell wall-associated NlpC family hydrolase